MITIVQRVLDDVQQHARETSPRECCGVLVGTGSRILESVRAHNLEESATRFQIDPRDHIRAIREARARQLDVVGFYHSHPHSRGVPSATDVAEAGYAGAMHLIVGVDEQGQPDIGLWMIDGTTVSALKFALADQMSATDKDQ